MITKFVEDRHYPKTLRGCIEYFIITGSMICCMFFGPFIIQYAGRFSGYELSMPVSILIFALLFFFSAILVLRSYKK